MRYAEITPELLDSAFTYTSYRAYVSQLLAKQQTTGANQTKELVEYTRLNEARMNRLDKTFEIEEYFALQLAAQPNNLLFLSITEAWCGDAAQVLPILEKLIASRQGWQHKIILRDEHPQIMDHFLTNGKSRSIPVTIALNQETLEVIGWWGPRPSGAQQLIDDLKQQDADMETVKTRLHPWYAADKGRQISQEWVARLVMSVLAKPLHQSRPARQEAA